jgi:hypothetical protein
MSRLQRLAVRQSQQRGRHPPVKLQKEAEVQSKKKKRKRPGSGTTGGGWR